MLGWAQGRLEKTFPDQESFTVWEICLSRTQPTPATKSLHFPLWCARNCWKPRGGGRVIAIAFRLPTRSGRTCLKSPCPSRLRARGRKFPPRGGHAPRLPASASRPPSPQSPPAGRALSGAGEGGAPRGRGPSAAVFAAPATAAAGGAPLSREQHLAGNPRRSRPARSWPARLEPTPPRSNPVSQAPGYGSRRPGDAVGAGAGCISVRTAALEDPSSGCRANGSWLAAGGRLLKTCAIGDLGARAPGRTLLESVWRARLTSWAPERKERALSRERDLLVARSSVES